MVRNLDSGRPVTLLNAMERRGVARENVVAVPASKANTAIKSMVHPHVFPEGDGRPLSIFALTAF